MNKTSSAKDTVECLKNEISSYESERARFVLAGDDGGISYCDQMIELRWKQIRDWESGINPSTGVPFEYEDKNE